LNKEKLESDVAFEKKQKDIKSKREEIEDLEKNLPSMPQSKSKAYFETRLTQLKKEVENEREEIQDYMAEIYNKNGMGKPDATIMSLLKNIDDKNLAPLAQIITSASAHHKNTLSQKENEYNKLKEENEKQKKRQEEMDAERKLEQQRWEEREKKWQQDLKNQQFEEKFSKPNQQQQQSNQPASTSTPKKTSRNISTKLDS